MRPPPQGQRRPSCAPAHIAAACFGRIVRTIGFGTIREGVMGRFSRSRQAAFDRDDMSPERDRHIAFGLLAALPALVLASALTSLFGLG
jgi:ABC-type tungstate transport system substrate-binding protein